MLVRKQCTTLFYDVKRVKQRDTDGKTKRDTERARM